jgi:D-xylose transport system substrate-binding protein
MRIGTWASTPSWWKHGAVLTAAVLALSGCGAAATAAPSPPVAASIAPSVAPVASASAAGSVAPAPTASGAAAITTTATGSVCYLAENTTTPAFEQETTWFVAAMKQLAPNVTVTTQNANNSQATQQTNVESCITQKVGAIALHPVDSGTTGGELTAAAAANVPVIAYEQPATGGPLAYYIAVDFHQVGQLEGQIAADVLGTGSPKQIMRLYGDPGDANIPQWVAGQNVVLQPLIASGQIKVVCDQYTPGWVPATAQTETENCLTKTGNAINAVVSVQDFLANAALAALTAQNLQGKVPVFGGNAAAPGVQNMLLGYEPADVMINFHNEMTLVAEATILALTKTTAPAGFVTTQYTNTGFPTIPEITLGGVRVDKTQVQTIVDTGLMSWSDICTGPAAQTPECMAPHPSTNP